ncbi:MAG: carboxypeptidase regulatory-like domain-containing protein [Limnochordales bacterium]|nr:carboxypeptidase regulatory-like domain-containing protein [Limnochordales bacterium]
MRGMRVKLCGVRAALSAILCLVTSLPAASFALLSVVSVGPPACAANAGPAGTSEALGQQQKGTVVGLVITPDGRGVAGARVHVKGTTLETATGADGEYKLEGVPAGWQTVEVTCEGMVAANSLALTVNGELRLLQDSDGGDAGRLEPQTGQPEQPRQDAVQQAQASAQTNPQAEGQANSQAKAQAPAQAGAQAVAEAEAQAAAPGQPRAEAATEAQAEARAEAQRKTEPASLAILMARASPEQLAPLDRWRAGNPGRPAADVVSARVRVGVIADQVVRAPEVVLTSQSADSDYISLATLTPGPQSDLTEDYPGTFVAEVDYRLKSQPTGTIRLFLVDDRGKLVTPPGPESSVTVAGGEGRVTVRQPLSVPKGTALVQPLVGLFPGDSPETLTWTFSLPCRVRLLAYVYSSDRVTNLMAHPEQPTAYVAIDQPDQENDRLVALAYNRRPPTTSMATISADSGPMAISDDGRTLYVASRTAPVVTVVHTDGLAAREVQVEHGDIVSIAAIGPDLIAYIYKKQNSDRYAGVVHDIRTNKEYPWIDDTDFPSPAVGIASLGIIYTVRNGYLEKWQYYYGQYTPMRLEKRASQSLGNHRYLLLDKAKGVVYYGRYKLDSENLQRIHAAVSDETQEFIALSPDGRWVVDSSYTIYETEHLFPVVELGRGDSPKPRAAFTSDGVIWLSEASRLLAFRLPRQEAER